MSKQNQWPIVWVMTAASTSMLQPRGCCQNVANRISMKMSCSYLRVWGSTYSASWMISLFPVPNLTWHLPSLHHKKVLGLRLKVSRPWMLGPPGLRPICKSCHTADVKACLSPSFQEAALRESETFDNDLRVAKNWPNVWLYCCASIRGPNDGRYIDLPGVTKPPVGPSAKQIHAACFDVKHPSSVFPAAQYQENPQSCAAEHDWRDQIMVKRLCRQFVGSCSQPH